MKDNFKSGFVTIIGRPNVGKSTLMNHLIGQKIAITSNKPQTTRNRIQTVYTDMERGQIVFLDTPGIFKPKRRFDRSMVASAWSGASDGDILVLVVDARRGFDAETRAIVDELNKQGREAVLVLNKTDLVTGEKLLPLAAELNAAGKFAETFMVSAATGEGLRDFYRYLADHLPESPWYYPEDHMSDLPLRLLAAEVVREKLFLYLQDELPYSLTVEPELWERRSDNSVRAEMTIYVEREGQKKIIVGRGGEMIKKVGQTARLELEEMLEDRIHLFLFVKVRENWSEDPARYQDWGLVYNV